MTEFDTFTSAVIDDKAYARITGYLKHAKNSNDLAVFAGGQHDNKIGYYIHPTLVETRNPHDKIMSEEIFGPILTAYVYADDQLDKTLDLVDSTTSFALTGAVFAEDRAFLIKAAEQLKMSAGNFYINDKSTGAVVGQQPFGGSRLSGNSSNRLLFCYFDVDGRYVYLSGTNDKAGSPHYLLRWSSPQAIKQNFQPLAHWTYPYMEK